MPDLQRPSRRVVVTVLATGYVLVLLAMGTGATFRDLPAEQPAASAPAPR
jgi:hypothetical protein